MEYYIVFLKCFSIAYLLFYNSWSKAFFKKEIFNNEFLNPLENSYFSFVDNGFRYSKIIIKYCSLLLLIFLFVLLNYQYLLELILYHTIDKNQNDNSFYFSNYLEFFLPFILPLISLLFFVKKISNSFFWVSVLSLIFLTPLNELLLIEIYKLRYNYLINDTIPKELQINYWNYFTDSFDHLFTYLICMMILVASIEFIKEKLKRNAHS